MDFGNLDVRKKLEQLVSPTGLAILPIYSFYKEFSTDNERDPCIMVKVIRYIIQHNSQSEDKMFMFQYCEKASALRNLVLHNQDYEDIIQCYKSFVGTVQKIRDCINIGKIQCDDAKSSMNKLNQFILQINSMIYIKTEKLQITEE